MAQTAAYSRWAVEAPQREAAASLLICTTAFDREGTLGGLVALSESERLHGLVVSAPVRCCGCDAHPPVFATRTPDDPEDFLHGREPLGLHGVRTRCLLQCPDERGYHREHQAGEDGQAGEASRWRM